MASKSATLYEFSVAPGTSRRRKYRQGAGSLFFNSALLVLVVALVGGPLLFGSVLPLDWGLLGAAALISFLLWIAACIRERVMRIAWTPLYVPLALFWGLGAFQLFGKRSFDPAGTRESLIKMGIDFMFFFVAGQLFSRAPEQLWNRAGLVVTLFAFGLALFAILQFLSSGGLIYWSVKSAGWTFGPYVNHNHYAGIMELLIPVAVGFAVSRVGNTPFRFLLWASIILAATSVLLSASRGGLIALCGEAMIFGALIWRRARAGSVRRIAIGVSLGLGVTAALLLWLGPEEQLRRLATVVTMANHPEATIGERIAVARDSGRILADHPWTGTGLGSFDAVHTSYQSFPSDVQWDHAHDDYAELLAESGIIGGLLALIALLMFFRQALRNSRERLRYQAGWIQFGAAVACAGLLIHSFSDFNLHIPANAMWFSVCAAAASAAVSFRGMTQVGLEGDPSGRRRGARESGEGRELA